MMYLAEKAGKFHPQDVRGRYEVNRLLGVPNNQLYACRYLVGDVYTIADMICYPWTVHWDAQG